MTETFRCDDKHVLVAYLYGEIDAEARREVERHLRTCTACAEEFDALDGVRQDLQAWVPPEADLGFAVTPPPPAVVPMPVSSRWAALRELPAWAQVAAATLAIGIGAAIANVQVQSTADGFVVTTGWLPATPAAQPAPASPQTTEQPWRGDLARLEQTLRRELAAQRATAPAAVAAAPAAPAGAIDTAALLRRVETMIEASEERQRQEMALRLTQAERNWNLRRTADLASINQRIGSWQGRTLAVQAGQQEMMNQLRRVSLTPPPHQ